MSDDPKDPRQDREAMDAERQRRRDWIDSLDPYTVFGVRVRSNTTYFVKLSGGKFRRFDHSEWADVAARQDVEAYLWEETELTVVSKPVTV